MATQTSVTPDVRVDDHGSIVILVPLTDDARAWMDEYLPDDAQTWGSGIVVEPRYVHDILMGMQADGLRLFRE